MRTRSDFSSNYLRSRASEFQFLVTSFNYIIEPEKTLIKMFYFSHTLSFTVSYTNFLREM